MSLSVAEHIKQKLSESEELVAIIDNKMYPLAVQTGVEFPFIVYERDGVQPNSTKDGSNGDTATVNIYVFADSYKQSVRIAELVRAALDNTEGSYDTFTVDECSLVDAAESYADNAYIQQLVFNITTY